MNEDGTAPGNPGITKRANYLEMIQRLEQKAADTDALLEVAMSLIKELRKDLGELHRDQNRLISTVYKHNQLLK